jgi:hypothetical protein
MRAPTLGWWRPAHGCDHDDCDFAALDVDLWLARQDDPGERLLRLAEALLNECVEEAAGADMSIQGPGGSLRRRNIGGPVLVLQAAIPAVSSAEESNPFTLKLALDVWGDDLVRLATAG